jgi:hypothetical protein
MSDRPPASREQLSPAPLRPVDQQLDLEGGLHDRVTNRWERLKLFEPAPQQIPGQLNVEAVD